MALHQILGSSSMSPFLNQISFGFKPSFVPRTVKVKDAARMSNRAIVRRSADYHPTIWKYEFIQSLTSEFEGEKYVGRFNELKREVIVMMKQIIDNPLTQLELIDTLQHLGISYHFKNEITEILKRIYRKDSGDDDWKKNNLYATALEFRLMRQHGFNVPQDVFDKFKDKISNCNICPCDEDINEMMCLYEASFLSVEGENILEATKYFTINYLEKYITLSKDELNVRIARHTLDFPLHWRMPRLEARWFIDIYERKANMNPVLLEIAKLDFNMVQSIHQKDLKCASRWWKSTGLGDKLLFARDRLTVSFFWAVGLRFEPQFGHFRRISTKVNALITIIDDIYDVYGTVEELQLFTQVIDKWDIVAMDQLPYYMKLCFLSLYNSINEMTFDILKDQGINVLPCLKNLWTDLCKAYLVEAKWYHSDYKPTLQEYLNNAWISIAGSVILVHAYFLVASPITKEDLESFKESVDIVRWSSIILRLADDLGTSPEELKRGDTPKSIQCYMNDTGASETDARKHIKHLIDETWKKINKVEPDNNSILSKEFIEIAKNLARVAQCIYQYGDGHGTEHQETKDRVVSLFIESIPII